jgi:thymidylate synthase (FAD)
MTSRRPTSPGAEEILGLYFPVLDHGFVALVDYMGTDECIERAARVSYGYGTRKASLTRGLIRYLRRHAHTTPSEMVEFKFHCCMPMFVARQWIRHRTACLAGDAELIFDLPGAGRRGRRQCHRVPIAKFYRMWHEGTSHPINKKKPSFLDRVDCERRYTIPELARLVGRREETLRNYVRDEALAGERISGKSKAECSIVVTGRAWHDFANQTHEARVRMRERLSRMKLRSCDESNAEIGHTNVVDVWESGIKPVFEVTLENGRRLKMSKDHRCLTERGWLTLEKAVGLRLGRNGNVVWSADAPQFAVNGTPAYQDRDWLAARRREGLGLDEIAERARISRHSIRKYLRRYGLGFTAEERSRLSGRAQRGQKRVMKNKRPWSAERLQKVRAARTGPASNFWKGGVSSDRENIGRWTTQVARRVHERWGFRCAICGSKARLHAHHVDPVWHALDRAREFENLMTLCGRCHDLVHAQNLELELLAHVRESRDIRRFWEERRPEPRPAERPKSRATRLVKSFSKVTRIEYAGEEMTYDIEVAGPHHNFVANGFIVHNSVNEYSGRYSLMPMLFYTPSEEQLQTQSRANNQGRSGDAVPAEQYAEALRRWEEIRDASRSAYEWMTEQEIARELARIDLPLSTYTQWYWKIDLHNLLHFLRLRVDAHAQWEIQEYGRVMAGMLQKVAPASYEAWIDYDVCGARMSRMELDALRRLVSAEGDALAARSGQSVDPKTLEELGLSKREIAELREKLAPTSRPDFTLDPRKALSAETFAERMAQAVPKFDKKPSD